MRVLLLLLLLLASPAMAARITALSATPGMVTITADAPLPVANSFTLGNPQRLVVDFVGVVDGVLTAVGANSVAGVRVAMFAPGTARLVIDITAPVEILSARAQGNRVVITLKRTTAAGFAAQVARGRRPLPLLREDGPPPPPTLPTDSFSLPADFARPPVSVPQTARPGAKPLEMPLPQPPLAQPAADMLDRKPDLPPPRPRAYGVKPRDGSKPLVVLDAGHGGKDVGAIAVTGGHEKDVTLAIARETARILEKSGKVRVRLTRDGDIFIPLGGRVRIARTARADLFISIHADAAANPDAGGASVYTLSAVASDAIAARLAARENKSDIIGGVNLGVEAPDVGDIMADLVRRATGNVSAAFADTLQASLEERIRFRGEFHHFAAFAVLKAPDVPSVLLETGYVTNAQDAEFLFSKTGQRTIAKGIAEAVQRHLIGD
ncbi:N-acetylmuramoyl-L-alanine amidase [Sandarakinorhabdus sp.]|uniref:N-acetylmuramoyl-L-alanine amidase family protein n=1 Tax=Sandarakinorhabdus sp. TaxID=1916663 RepID=UPI00286E312E|nr:N-acetylmuramoyl-L-alanine amidase [Sandarakinorhabdus sp.]